MQTWARRWAKIMLKPNSTFVFKIMVAKPSQRPYNSGKGRITSYSSWAAWWTVQPSSNKPTAWFNKILSEKLLVFGRIPQSEYQTTLLYKFFTGLCWYYRNFVWLLQSEYSETFWMKTTSVDVYNCLISTASCSPTLNNLSTKVSSTKCLPTNDIDREITVDCLWYPSVALISYLLQYNPHHIQS